jgi:hypothetical protein
MPLLGNGIFLAWHDLAGDYSVYDDWHSREHMPERLAIPGFVRGRRYVATGDGPHYFVVYETDDVGVLKSDAYLERLNNPTEATRAIMPAFRNMNRTLARIVASFGTGVGGLMSSLQLSGSASLPDGLQRRLSDALRSQALSNGIVGAHLVQGDRATTSGQTKETALRGGPDAAAEWVVLLEGYESDLLRRGEESLLSILSGALDVSHRFTHRLAHIISAR